MNKHEDGSVTLSKVEFEELSRAYGNLRNILNRQPTSLDDYFVGARGQYVEVCKWGNLLEGRSWTEEDEKNEMEGFEDEEDEGMSKITKTTVRINDKTDLTVAHPKCTDDVLKEKLQALITDARHILILRHNVDEFPDLEFGENWERLLSLGDL